MERRLNARGTVVAAWVIFGLLIAGAAGFAFFLLLPSGSGGLPADSPPQADVAPPTSTPPPSGRGIFSGSLERVDGQALVIGAGVGPPMRVLVRGGASVGVVSTATAADLRPGEPAIITLSRQTDGRMLVVRVRLQAATVPIIVFAGAGATVAGSATDPGNVAGVIETVEPGKLHLRTERDTQVFDLSGNVRVTRFTAAALTDLRPNQRIAVDGERLIDGSLAAYAVHAVEFR